MLCLQEMKLNPEMTPYAAKLQLLCPFTICDSNIEESEDEESGVKEASCTPHRREFWVHEVFY